MSAPGADVPAEEERRGARLPAGAPRARWSALSRALSAPQRLQTPLTRVLVTLVCASGVCAVVLGEALGPENLSLGGWLLLFVVVATWLLPTFEAACIALLAISAAAYETYAGTVDPVTGNFRFLSVVMVAIFGQLTVRAVNRAEAERSRVSAELLRSERRRADEAALQLEQREELLGELRAGAAVNALQAMELTVANERLELFTARAAHELRAPLAIMRSTAERALDRPREPADYTESLHTILKEVVRLATMTDTLLVLAHADAGGQVLELLDITDVVSEVVARWEPLTSERGIRIELDLADEAVVRGDALLLGRLVENLVDNAVRHTPTGGVVTVSTRCIDHSIEVAVADTGTGVNPALRGRLFELFARGEESRSRSSPGAGLGLSLVRAVAEAHGGTARLDEDVVSGARFVVRLPVSERP